MQIEYREGSVIDGFYIHGAMAHGVNCKGVMGLGVAKAVRNAFPSTYKDYRSKCLKGELHRGQILVTHELMPGARTGLVYNLATQEHPGKDASYIGVAICFARMFDNMLGQRTSVAIPRIGCGIGGLNWPDVETIISIAGEGLPITVYVYDPQ